MIEIAAGILVVAAAVVVLMGEGDTFLAAPDLYPLLGAGGTAAIAGLGVILVCHAVYRRMRRRRHGDQHWLRTTGLVWVALLIQLALAFAVPAWVEALNLIKIGGFPLGFYMTAQGSLVGLAILAFAAAARQDSIDAQEGVAEA